MAALRLGEIPFANTWPLYRILRETTDCSNVEFVTGVPTILNEKLRQGELDVSPSSSVEYILNPDLYDYLPGISVSSSGPVQSILLFSRKPLEELDGSTVAFTDQSATSVLLTRVVLEHFHRKRPRYLVAKGPPRAVLQGNDAYLLIGDDALCAALRPGPWRTYDLGSIWEQEIGLPFVYALWIARKQCFQDPGLRHRLEALGEAFQRARESAAERFAELAAAAPQSSWYPSERLVNYWQTISYTLDEDHLRGMDHFAKLIATLPCPLFPADDQTGN